LYEVTPFILLNTGKEQTKGEITVDMSSVYRKTFEIELKDALNSLIVEISIAVLPAPIPEVENTGPTFDAEDFDGTAFPIESMWQTYMDLQ